MADADGIDVAAEGNAGGDLYADQMPCVVAEADGIYAPMRRSVD